MSKRFNKQYPGTQGIIYDPACGILFDTGTTVPSDGALGFAPGCIFIDQDASGIEAIYINVGTRASADFNILNGGLDLATLTATAAELNRAADVSGRVVGLAVSTSITELAHDGKTILMTGAGAARTFTQSVATGGGARFRFVVGEVNTSNYIINSVVGTDLMEGIIIGASTTDSATDAARTWLSGATDDSVLLNGTTTGGVAIGDWVEFEDLSATGWFVRGMITQSGSEATPFRDAVA